MQHTEYLERMMLIAEEAVFDSLYDVFVEHPTIQTISWTQYTPYFNDGEPCEFSVHDCAGSILINGEEYPWDDKEQKALYEKVSSIVGTIPEQILQFLGEGRLTVKHDETVTVEEISHE